MHTNIIFLGHMQGTYLVMQAATKMMVERKVSNGSIINMSSILAKVSKSPINNFYHCKHNT